MGRIDHYSACSTILGALHNCPMPFAKINDAVMHYRVSGSGSGTPILFSNSLGTDLRIWDAVVEMLGDGVRTIRYDMRGHGLSEHGDAPSTIAGYAADAAG